LIHGLSQRGGPVFKGSGSGRGNTNTAAYR
jgi:hypothetical protein